MFNIGFCFGKSIADKKILSVFIQHFDGAQCLNTEHYKKASNQVSFRQTIGSDLGRKSFEQKINDNHFNACQQHKGIADAVDILLFDHNEDCQDNEHHAE